MKTYTLYTYRAPFEQVEINFLDKDRQPIWDDDELMEKCVFASMQVKNCSGRPPITIQEVLRAVQERIHQVVAVNHLRKDEIADDPKNQYIVDNLKLAGIREQADLVLIYKVIAKMEFRNSQASAKP